MGIYGSFQENIKTILEFEKKLAKIEYNSLNYTNKPNKYEKAKIIKKYNLALKKYWLDNFGILF